MILLLVAANLLGLPTAAVANVGTPLMWAEGLHLLFGNLVIGVVEGVLLARFFRLSAGRSISLMIVANYVSAWVGFVWLNEWIVRQLEFDLYNVWFFLWVMVGVSYALSLLLEWPFVAGCFRTTTGWFRRSVAASLVVQSISYVLLFSWYWTASRASLYTDMSIVRPTANPAPQNVQLYYIGDDGDVHLRDLADGKVEDVFDLNSSDPEDSLALRPTPTSETLWEIVVLRDSGDFNNPNCIPIGVAFGRDSVPHKQEGGVETTERGARPGGSPAARLGSARESAWELRAGFWPREGLLGVNSRTNSRVHFALEMPFARWAVRHVTLLPADKAVFQLGQRQICLVDLESRKTSLIAFGRGPLVVLKTPERSPTSL